MMRTGLDDTFAAIAEQLGASVLDIKVTALRDRLTSLVGATPDWSVGVSAETIARFPNLASLGRGSAVWPEIVIGCGRFAVASTGSVVLAEAGHGDRLAALLCTHHVVLVPAPSIVETSTDASRLLRGWLGSGTGRYVTFAAGPSRTSDIERVLAIGVHGPARLTVVLVRGWQPDGS